MKRLLGLLFVICMLFGCGEDVPDGSQSPVPEESAEMIPVDNSRYKFVDSQIIRYGPFNAVSLMTIKDTETDVEYLITTRRDGIAVTPIIAISPMVGE